MMEQLVQSVAVICAFVAFGALLVALVQKARAQNRTPALIEPEEEFVNIALCATRGGFRTHYHDIGVEPLNYVGYPSISYLTGAGYRTLCGADVSWDMQNQEAKASCLVCGQALAKLSKESTNES